MGILVIRTWKIQKIDIATQSSVRILRGLLVIGLNLASFPQDFEARICAKSHISSCEPSDILHRLDKFFKLFLSDGLNSEFAYAFGLKDA